MQGRNAEDIIRDHTECSWVLFDFLRLFSPSRRRGAEASEFGPLWSSSSSFRMLEVDYSGSFKFLWLEERQTKQIANRTVVRSGLPTPSTNPCDHLGSIHAPPGVATGSWGRPHRCPLFRHTCCEPCSSYSKPPSDLPSSRWVLCPLPWMKKLIVFCSGERWEKAR